eukprot:COSAG01_NODE_1216_length_11192_cov_10.328678_5_plen_74_part_00
MKKQPGRSRGLFFTCIAWGESLLDLPQDVVVETIFGAGLADREPFQGRWPCPFVRAAPWRPDDPDRPAPGSRC